MARPALPLAALLVALGAHAQGGEALGHLALSPAAPAAGERVEVTYRPSSDVAGAGGLVLRGRLRTPDDRAYGWGAETRSLAALDRGADGLYRGHFTLPADVVYAVLAVSTPAGDAVDTNLREGWPVLVHGPDGRPLADAFDQRGNDLTGADSRGALATARERVRLYPGDPGAWASLSFWEQIMGGSAAVDSAAADQLARVRRFDRELSASESPDPDRAAGLLWLARGVDDGVAERWTDGLIADAPTHPAAVQWRTVRAVIDLHPSPDSLVAALDELWDEVGPAERSLTGHGLRAAVEAGDAEAVRRWASRTSGAYPWERSRAAGALVQLAETRADGARLYRALVDEAPDADARPLFATVGGAERARAARDAGLWGQLGRALADAGDAEAALPALDRAVDGTWDTDLLRAAARVRLATGDTARAADALARIAADPALSPGAADTTAALGRRLVGGAWPGRVAEARAQLRRWTLADAQRTTLASPVALADRRGGPVPFRDVLGDDAPTVVVLFATGCQYCRAATPHIEALAERYAPDGVRVAVVMQDPPGEAAFAALASFGYDGTVFFDPRRELTTALRSAGVPAYFVFDAAGALRYAFTGLAELPRQLEALASEGG